MKEQPKTMWDWMRDRYLERQAKKKTEEDEKHGKDTKNPKDKT